MLGKGLLVAGAMALFGLGTGTASAQTGPYDWSGFYTGFNVGYAFGTAHYLFNTDGDLNDNAGDTFSHPISGMPIGGYLGIQWQTPQNVVFGIEASVQSAFVYLDAELQKGPFYEEDFYSHKVHYWGTLGGRVGFATGNLLIFAEGGGAFGHLVGRVESDQDPDLYMAHSQLAFGYFAGIGFDYAIGEHVSIGVGIRHTALGPNVFQGNLLFIEDDQQSKAYTDHEVRTRFNSILVRLQYNF